MRTYKILTLLVFLLLPPMVWADLVLVANSESEIERLTHSEVVNIYLGRYRRLSNGTTAQPLDLADNSQIKATFYQQLVDKNLAEINAYWSRLVFSGKTRPPMEVGDTIQALAFLADNPNGLAYIDRSALTPDVMIVFEWPE